MDRLASLEMFVRVVDSGSFAAAAASAGVSATMAAKHVRGIEDRLGARLPRIMRVAGRFLCNHGQAVRIAALQGLGIALQPETVLVDDLAAGRLVRVLPGWSYMPSPMYLIYAQDGRPTAKLRTIIDFLLTRFGPRGLDAGRDT